MARQDICCLRKGISLTASSLFSDSWLWVLDAAQKIQGPERWGNKQKNVSASQQTAGGCQEWNVGDFLGSNFWTSSAVFKVEKKNLENRPFVFDHCAPKSTEGWWNRNEVCMLHVCMATWCPRGRWLLQNASKKLHSMVSTSCSGVRKFWDPPPREVPP